MFTLLQKRTLYCIAVLLFAGLFLTTCDMGLGPSVDLEPPILRVTCIVLPDGTEIPVEEDGNKLLIGPGILVGPGFELKGEAWDNVIVEQILVEETGPNAEQIDGHNPIWSDATIGRKAANGYQSWSLILDGIKKGERTITITAYDRPKNIGPESVKQLTLLVDTEPPFVESIKVERQAGIQVDLLPRVRLAELDPYLFDHIDYFQNEYFTIRASVFHDFSLSGVTLNLINEEGNEIFSQGRERTEGTVYTPAWYFTAADLIAANPAYATGRHYLNVSITARAEAGHAGGTQDTTNLLYNLCWYPEADYPRIQMAIASDDIPAEDEAEKIEIYSVEKGSILPVKIFDDDNIDQVYAAMVSASAWNAFMPTSADDAKLQWLYNDANRASFNIEAEGTLPLNTPRLEGGLVRNTVIAVETGNNRGEHRLITLALDKKEDGKPGVWSHRMFTVYVIEEGIPLITIESPAENTSAVLSDGNKFTITGSILNLDAVEFLRIAWVPAGLNWDTEKQMAEAEQALKADDTIPENDIVIWDLELTFRDDRDIGGKLFKVQEFSKTFNIEEDFIFYVNGAGKPENEPKFFMLYTKGRAGDEVFQPYRLLAYLTPPEIIIHRPITNSGFAIAGPFETIPFLIEAKSSLGVPITFLQLWSDKEEKAITLTPTPTGENTWAGANSHDYGDYSYKIIARDKLGNEEQKELYISITTLPILQSVITPHAEDAWFSSRDIITFQAVFNSPISIVEIDEGRPQLRIEGFDDGIPRYAQYRDGEESTVLTFTYEYPSGVRTASYPPPTGYTGGLTVTALELNGGSISAGWDDWPETERESKIFTLSAGMTAGISGKNLNVDGISPTIDSIKISGDPGDGDYPGWYKRGDKVIVEVTTSKEVKALGTPELILNISNYNETGANPVSTTRNAPFVHFGATDDIMVFEYAIAARDEAVPVTVNSVYFETTDLAMISDRVGARGNVLSLNGAPAAADTVNVDARPPAALVINGTGGNAPGHTTTITTGNIESTAKFVQYTTDGINWTDITDYVIGTPYVLGPFNAPNNYNVMARQIDRAGNISPNSNADQFQIGGACEFISVICDNTNGAYVAGQTITFKLIFSGRVNAAAGTIITFTGGVDTYSTTGPTRTVGLATAVSGVSVLTVTYPIPANANEVFDPINITNINLSGITREGTTDQVQPEAGKTVNSIRDEYNASRTELGIVARDPTIETSTPTMNSTAAAGVMTTAQNNKQIELNFSHAVWPELKLITIKPAAGWHIPPVLTNDDFAAVYNHPNVVDNDDNPSYRKMLDIYYTKTTHGLLKDADGRYNGTPDTSTKYVLRYDTGISDTTGAVNTLRTVFNAAAYMKQDIETINTVAVTGVGGKVITLNLPETLADGRQWEITIEDGAFRDRAGNTFKNGWYVGAPTNPRTFWSQNVAVPVIRVNRVTNNRSDTDPTTQTDNTGYVTNVTNTTTTGLTNRGTATENISRTNVQYRIDCETPGAVITASTTSGTPITGYTNVAPIAANSTTGGGNSQDGAWNSSTPDASAAQLATMGANGTYPGTTPAIGQHTVGDANMYSARKDYIAAQATRAQNANGPALTASGKGYEGAFKTLVVYRNPTPKVGQQNWRGNYMAIEGSNVLNGAVTIPGFPMSINDRTGTKLKFLYATTAANSQLNTAAVGNPSGGNGSTWTNAGDWIFISWEIVSNFEHVGMTMVSTTPNTEFDHDAWSFDSDHANHNFRKYGNYGLRTGNGN